MDSLDTNNSRPLWIVLVLATFGGAIFHMLSFDVGTVPTLLVGLIGVALVALCAQKSWGFQGSKQVAVVMLILVVFCNLVAVLAASLLPGFIIVAMFGFLMFGVCACVYYGRTALKNA